LLPRLNNILFVKHCTTMTRTKIAELIFDSKNSILYMHILENSEMTIENTIEHYKIIESLVGNLKYIAIIDSGNYFTTNPEVFDYTSKHSTFKNRVATAHYNLSMANKLTVDFFKSNYKPDMAFVTFKTKEECLDWWQSEKDSLL